MDHSDSNADSSNEDEGFILAPDDTTLIHNMPQLLALARAPTTETNWQQFIGLMDEVISEAATIVNLPVRA